MADKQIIPYGINLNKKPVHEESLAPSVIPLRKIALAPPRISHDQSYYAQATHHLEIALSPPHLLLEDKPRKREPLFSQLHPPKPIKVPKKLNILPPRPNKKLMEVRTNKEGDPIYAKYQSVKQWVTIEGARAEPD